MNIVGTGIGISGWTVAAVVGVLLWRHRKADEQNTLALKELLGSARAELADTAEDLYRERENSSLLRSAIQKEKERTQRALEAEAAMQERLNRAGKELFAEGVPGAVLREAGLDYMPSGKAAGSNMQELFKAAVGLDANGKRKEQVVLTSTSSRDAAIITRLRGALDATFSIVELGAPESLLDEICRKARIGSWWELFSSGQVPSLIRPFGDRLQSVPPTLSMPDASDVQPSLPEAVSQRTGKGRTSDTAGAD